MLIRRGFFKSRSVQLTWAMSYLVIFIVPLLLSFGIYQRASNTLIDESTRANSFMLAQLKSKLEARLDDVDRLMIQIAWDDQLLGLLSNSRSDEATLAYDYYQLSRNLRPLQAAYPWVSAFYVYISDRDAAISSNSVWTGNMVWDNLFAGPDFSYADWLRLMNAPHNKDAVPMALPDERKAAFQSVVVMQSVPLSDRNRPQGTITLTINIKELISEVSDLTFNSGTRVYILNRNNQLIASSDTSAVSGKVMNELVGEPDTAVWDRTGREDILRTTQVSQKYGWKFVSVTPRSNLMQKVNNLRVLAIASTLFILAAGVALILLFTRRNYNPIHQMLNVLPRNSSQPPQSGNELGRIQHALVTTLEEKNTMERLLSDQHRTLDNRILAQLLAGEMPEDIQLQETLSRLGLLAPSGGYAVAVFYIENIDQAFVSDDALTDDARIKLVKFTLSNVFSEMISAGHPCHLFEADGVSVCLTALRSGDPAALNDLREACAEGMRFLDTRCDIQVSVAISNLHEGVSGILTAWHESLDSLQYRQVFGSGDVLTYAGVMASRESRVPYYPLNAESENRLLGLLRAGDGESAVALVTALTGDFLKKHRPSGEALRCLMADIAATCLKASENASSTGISFMDDDNSYLHRIMQARTIEGMQREVHGLIRQSAGLCAENRRESVTRHRGASELVSAITRVIEAHFADPNLNIAGLSEHFDMVPYYLSRQFRDETGEALLDYIARFRAGKVRELLEASDLSLTEIAEQTGFIDSNALIRAFKKIEGTTPGKYRDTHKRQG